jgi:hypothetical protein
MTHETHHRMFVSMMCVTALLLCVTAICVATLSASNVVPRWHGMQRDTVKWDDTAEEDIYEDDNEANSDSYRGRSAWTPEQFGRLADSMGIDNRKGQSAAVAHVITSLKQGNVDVARKRLQMLLATPGYMLDPDLAQVLVALESLLGRKQVASSADGGKQMRDTVYMIDTVYRERPEMSSKSDPSVEQRTRDTVYVDVVKHDTVYVPLDSTAEERDLTGPTDPAKSQQRQEERKPFLSDSTRMNRMAAMAEEIAKLKQELTSSAKLKEPTTITRQCYTILISSHANRDVAEQEVKRLKRSYKRARLAISDKPDAQYSVIVGYYQTPQAARIDAITVSRATGKRCRAVATTIAEKI